MTEILSFELAGDGGVQIGKGSVEELRRTLAKKDRGQVPRFRLLKVSQSDSVSPMRWADIEEFRCRAEELLRRPDLLSRMKDVGVACIDVKGAIRDLPAEWLELRESGDPLREMVILDLEMPRGAPELLDQVVLGWQQQCFLAAAPSQRRVERLPPKQSAEAAAAAASTLRQFLADDGRFLDSVAVGRLLSGNPEHANPKMHATRSRQAGRILGVWDGNAYRYPAFQFNADGQARADVAKLIDVLPKSADGTWRDAALWLYAPDSALDGRTPAEVFVDDPARVISLARARRDGDDGVD